MERYLDRENHDAVGLQHSVRKQIISLMGATFLIILLFSTFATLYLHGRSEAGIWQTRQQKSTHNTASLMAAYLQQARQALYSVSLLGRICSRNDRGSRGNPGHSQALPEIAFVHSVAN
jgi:hypothetical protein